jgi:hypothetical protein
MHLRTAFTLLGPYGGVPSAVITYLPMRIILYGNLKRADAEFVLSYLYIIAVAVA